MLFAKIQFGSQSERAKGELQDLAETYLAALCNAGQLGDHYFLTWIEGALHAHVLMTCSQACQTRYHSDWGRKSLAEVARAFGQNPKWTITDDDARKRTVSWKKAPFLYLFTHAFDRDSPVCRGDNGRPVPVCLLPLSFEQKQSLRFWQGSYYDHDNIWLGCRALEIPAYRQMADPESNLAETGRGLCREVEQATGIPTFYYLQRYWGRKQGEDQRRCPVCGGLWRRQRPADGRAPFWQFDFKCDPCRLVSHLGVSDDGGRHTKIGEFKKPKLDANRDVQRSRRARAAHASNSK